MGKQWFKNGKRLLIDGVRCLSDECPCVEPTCKYIYYYDTEGDDSDGLTRATAFSSITKAIQACVSKSISTQCAECFIIICCSDFLINDYKNIYTNISTTRRSICMIGEGEVIASWTYEYGVSIGYIRNIDISYKKITLNIDDTGNTSRDVQVYISGAYDLTVNLISDNPNHPRYAIQPTTYCAENAGFNDFINVAFNITNDEAYGGLIKQLLDLRLGYGTTYTYNTIKNITFGTFTQDIYIFCRDTIEDIDWSLPANTDPEDYSSIDISLSALYVLNVKITSSALPGRLLFNRVLNMADCDIEFRGKNARVQTGVCTMSNCTFSLSTSLTYSLQYSASRRDGYISDCTFSSVQYGDDYFFSSEVVYLTNGWGSNTYLNNIEIRNSTFTHQGDSRSEQDYGVIIDYFNVVSYNSTYSGGPNFAGPALVNHGSFDEM